MRSTARHVSIGEIVDHLLGGTSLGFLFALALIVGNRSVAAVISGHQFPELIMLGLALISASFMAIGSAISGFIFSSIEKSSDQR
jgi:Na+/H+ antiporter NhaC